MKPNIGARRDAEAQGAENSAPSIWGRLKARARAIIDDMKQINTEMFNGAVTPLERLQRSIKHGLLLLGQLCLIMGVYAAGCAIASVLPISLPGNILGMVLLLVLLGTHVLKTKYISEACDYLIENMSIFFIPAGVAIMGCFSLLESSAAKFAFVCIATTVIVFLATSYTVLFVSWVMAKMGCDMPEAASVAGADAASAAAPANTNVLAHEDASAPASCTTPSAPNAAPASTEKEA